MSVSNTSLKTAGDATSSVQVEKGQIFMFSVTGTFVGTWTLQFMGEGDIFRDIGASYTVPKSKQGISPLRGSYKISMSAHTSGAAIATIYS